MSIGLIGRKVGMTQVFQADGTMITVSVVAIEPNTVTATTVRPSATAAAVQVGIEPSRRLSKPEAGQLQVAAQGRGIREFRVEDAAAFEVGQTIDVSLFAAGDLIDVTGTFEGQGLRRHHQAPQLPPRSQDPRLRPPSRAGLHRPRHHPRPRLPRLADGRPHG